MKRRTLLVGGLAAAGAVVGAAALALRSHHSGDMGSGMMGSGMGGMGSAGFPFAPKGGEPFRAPPLLDAGSGRLSLTTMAGHTRFAGGAPTPTMGFAQTYLGPTIRMKRGREIAAQVANGTRVPVSVHWHGLNVPSDADGGAPQSAIRPSGRWSPTLPVDQPAATLWYHTHVHGRTAPDMWAGLAGAIILEDGDETGLPSDYGRDDLVLLCQDKTFDEAGRAVYAPGMMGLMHGTAGTVLVVNGQIAPVARVPAGPVRLRFINASNGALHRFAFKRPAYLVGVDQGFLPAPVEITELRLSPGERAEVVIDMGEGGTSTVGASIAPAGGMGMMGGGAGRANALTFTVDASMPVRATLPSKLPAASTDMDEPVATRRFRLESNMGPMQMVRRAVGRGPVMSINGEAYDPARTAFTASLGTVERWTVETGGMPHPFHAHGVKFRLADPRRPEETGWKDVAYVEGRRDLIVSIDAPARDGHPFMFHCHILEHEDAGMMGQFLTV